MGEWYTNPSWWEAIGTILAFSLALIILFVTKIMKPHISVSDITLSWIKVYEIPHYKQEFENIPSKIHLSWRIHNKPLLKIFGKDVTKLHTMYWLEKIAEGDWVYQGTLNDLPFLPKNGDWLQTLDIERKSFDEGKYILTLHFSSDNLPIGGCQNEIIYRKSMTSTLEMP